MTIRTPERQHQLEHARPEQSIYDCAACRIERAKCRKKRRFPDLDAANTRGQQVNIETGWEFHLVSYPCPWCRAYHLTKAKPGTARWKRSERRRLAWLRDKETLDLLTDTKVITSPHLRDGHMYRMPAQTGTILVIGIRPLNDVEHAGEEARHQVREGLADVLAWLGQDVGPPPAREGRGAAMLARIKELRR